MVLLASTPETLVLQLSRAARSLPLRSAVTHKQLVQPFKWTDFLTMPFPHHFRPGN